MPLLLLILIFAPLIAAAAIWGLPARREAWIPRIALGTSLLTLVAAIPLWFGVLTGGPGLTGEFEWSWVSIGDQLPGPDAEFLPRIAVSFHIGLDAISGPLVMLTAVLMPLAVACSFTSIHRRQRDYYAWLLALAVGMFGVFAARDVLLFYVFFELTLIPLYFLIGIWGGPQRRYAANKFFLYTFVGSVLTFAGILYLAIRAADLAGSTGLTFDMLTLSSLTALTATEQSLLFLAFFCGFAIKVPFFPLHTWLPLAHTEAPTAGSVLLAGVLLKLGTYGFLRFALPMVPAGALAWANVMGVLAVCGIIYGGLICWVQQDIKKLVAYSSVSHLGFCMLGMFSMHLAGLSGSVLYMINHGISTGALFLVVGMIYERYHTRDMARLGGLARKMPVMAFFLILFTLSSIGLPGLNGFVSEFTVLFGAFNSDVLGPAFAAFGASGILIGAIYMLYMVGRILFGPVVEPAGTPDLSVGLTRDLDRREVAILAPLAALVVILGVWPTLVTRPLEPVLENQIQARLLAAGGAKSELRRANSESPVPDIPCERVMPYEADAPEDEISLFALRTSLFPGGAP